MTPTAVEQHHQGSPVALADRRRVVIRQLDAGDGPALVAAIEHADPWDLRRRFMGTPPPSSFLLRQLQRADGVHDCAFGAFTEDGRLVGVAQFDRDDDRPTAEFAIEVAHDWQHSGLGTALVRELARHARALGVREFTATYYADNIGIRRLLHDVGRVVASSFDCGEGEARVDISGTE